MSQQYHLSQANIARMRANLEDKLMEDFVNLLEPYNQVAEQSPGFVWRLKNDEGKPANVQQDNDTLLLVNMSVWEDAETLFKYTYYSDHVKAFRRRTDWFDQINQPYFVMWWIPVGHIPTIEEAMERLDYLRRHGPTPYAFTFKTQFTIDEMLNFTPPE